VEDGDRLGLEGDLPVPPVAHPDPQGVVDKVI
jgi:hypothetical protein